MGTRVEDEYVHLEDLGSPLVRRLVEEENVRLKGFLGGSAERFKGRVVGLLSRPRAVSVSCSGHGFYVLYRGVRDVVSYSGLGGLTRRVVMISGESEVLASLEEVAGGDGVVGVSVAPSGADEGYLSIVGRDGRRVWRVEGSVWDPAVVGGELFYVRFYRRGVVPSGGEAPTARVVRLDEGGESVVWGGGVVGRGETVSLSYYPEAGLLVYVVHHGWSSSTIYAAWEDEPSSAVRIAGGDAVYKPAGWLEGLGLVVLEQSVSGDRLLLWDGGRVRVLAEPLTAIEAARVVSDYIAAVTVSEYMHKLVFFDHRGVKVWVYEPREPVTVYSWSTCPRGGGLLLLETSFTTPYRISLLDPLDARVEVLEEAPWRVNARVEEFWARSRDGTLVHAWVAVPANTKPRAVVVYGYGGFAVSMTPRYSILAELFMREGLAYAVVNTRGGREHGEKWHREGMLKSKHKVFEDYAAVVGLLKSLGVRVVGLGASNGGLLVGAVATRWPELLDVALIGYPILDMLRYHKLYIGRVWVPEYGDPDDPEMRRYLLSYSPYHNIPVGKRMPYTLVYTGLHDDRVHPAHAFKFVAKARRLGHSSVYLRVETRAGHRGAAPEARAEELADILAFTLKALGVSGG